MTVFIQKGDAPMSAAQAINRGLQFFNAEKAQYERETGLVTGDPDYKAWSEQWLADNQINGANNLFNNQLAACRNARTRLARYRLADGRAEVTEIDAAGETIVVQEAIAALPATVTVTTESGDETVPNPMIVADDAERAIAQATIAALPSEVTGFDAALPA